MAMSSAGSPARLSTQEIELEGSPVPRLPSGWKSALSQRTGKIVFVHTETGERTSEYPPRRNGRLISPARDQLTSAGGRLEAEMQGAQARNQQSPLAEHAVAASPVVAVAVAAVPGQAVRALEASTQVSVDSPDLWPVVSGALAPTTLFDSVAHVSVYLIRRSSIKCPHRAKGAFECFTATVKATGELVLVAVRETGLSDFLGPPATVRFFSEDIKPACSDGVVPETNWPSYVGELVPKSEGRFRVFSLYRRDQPAVGAGQSRLPADHLQVNGRQELGLHNTAEEHRRDLQSSIKVRCRSRAKVPEPIQIQAQLCNDNQPTRMLQNFCAEKQAMTTKLARFDDPVTSRKNFVLVWEEQSDIAGACDRSAFSSADILADNNIVEFAKVGSDDFQLNVKDTLTPFQSIGIALSSICAHK